MNNTVFNYERIIRCKKCYNFYNIVINSISFYNDYHLNGYVCDKCKQQPIKEVIYIAGPMAGYVNHNFEQFDKWAKILTDMGFDVINPAELTRQYWKDNNKSVEDCTYAEMLNHDFSEIIKKQCISAFFLNGWRDSNGAQFEYHYFDLIKGNIYFEAVEGQAIID